MFIIDYRGPYDWPWMCGFLRHRTVEGVEIINADSLQRVMAFDGARGVATIHIAGNNQLRVTLSGGLLPVADEALTRLRRWLDLDTDPQPIIDTLGELAAPIPGLRLPGCVDPFEQMIRAVLGQLVSVAMAAKLTSKLVQAYGEPLEGQPGWRCFPDATILARARWENLKALGMSKMRADAIINLAQLCLDGQLMLSRPENVEQGIKALMKLPGIGRWTASYFALRGWQSPDVFLPDDYAIKLRFPGMTPAQIRRYAERWSPWRSYALLHIWYNHGWQPDQLIAK
ncbi:DNA-3-methyladenine glycosylase 2 [Atlantibacter hermannii]|uniref:DNA-3-methyladenine glycosylase 2 n=1 Tax=Atlantibacter hermannii TaxID=565 RepID=UPI0019324634|nr:DNA-3-methyladenine glycosylase 2 [Atlantibacter hermannii]MBL7634035.1 DNA-3-methyladenine glycosylase 2 [Atlantibacter hermannii]MBL7673343.1 DNA-3-methyladenine glycosylase 2 [Atlantibacter hermannii]